MTYAVWHRMLAKYDVSVYIYRMKTDTKNLISLDVLLKYLLQHDYISYFFFGGGGECSLTYA